MIINCEYKIREDIGFFIEAEGINKLELSESTGISRSTLDSIEKNAVATNEVCEKLYSYIYQKNYRLNSVKEELINAQYSESIWRI